MRSARRGEESREHGWNGPIRRGVPRRLSPRSRPIMTRLYPLLALALLLPLAACDTGGDDDDGAIRRVLITEVEVEAAPLVQDDGDDWDSGAGIGAGEEPDIYFELVNSDTGSPILATTVEEFSNVQPDDLPIVWSTTPGTDEMMMEEVSFTRFGTPLAFDLWDEDPQLTKGDDDFMGSTESFLIQDLIDQPTPPTVFTVQSDDGSISVRMRLRYER